MAYSSPFHWRRPMRLTATVLVVALGVSAAAMAATSPVGAAVNGNNLAPVPPMGFNDWARYTCGVNESIMVGNANALVATGLAAKGYRTVTVDDCWMAGARDANGNLVADPKKFPHGMKWLGDYLHARGLSFGIYEDAGTSTCGRRPGSLGHEQADANLFASWGADYLKLDGCNVPVPAGQTKEQAYRDRYAAMSTALAHTGRPIVFSESAPAYFRNDGPTWYSVLGWVAQYGQLWRERNDIASHRHTNKWSSVLVNYGYNVPLSRYAGPNHWNDPDFLITGDGLTDDEARSQMALWAMMAAPLILSTDVAGLSATSLATVGNSGVIAVDQDRLGIQGALVAQTATVDTLVRPLSGGDRAVAILNRSTAPVTASTTAALAGFTGGAGCTYRVTDLWTGTTSTTTGPISATVPAHGTAIWRVRPSAGCGTVHPTGQLTGTAGGCVDGNAGGTSIVLSSCAGTASQRWTLPGDGTVRALGKCLTATGTANDSPVGLATCTAAASQRWTYHQSGNLTNGASGKCLDARGGATADGTPLDVFRCGAEQLNQIWSLPV